MAGYRITYQNQLKGKNKYSAKTTQYNGFTYHSKKEAGYAEHLDWRLKAKEILSWTRQHKIDIKIKGIHWRNYYIDFRAVRKDGTIEYIEVKGFMTEDWKMKWDALSILKDELLETDSELIVIT